jgi:hypothetical protein
MKLYGYFTWIGYKKHAMVMKHEVENILKEATSIFSEAITDVSTVIKYLKNIQSHYLYHFTYSKYRNFITVPKIVDVIVQL